MVLGLYKELTAGVPPKKSGIGETRGVSTAPVSSDQKVTLIRSTCVTPSLHWTWVTVKMKCMTSPIAKITSYTFYWKVLQIPVPVASCPSASCSSTSLYMRKMSYGYMWASNFFRQLHPKEYRSAAIELRQQKQVKHTNTSAEEQTVRKYLFSHRK